MSEGKYIIEFCPEKKMNRVTIEIVARNMGLPIGRIISDSRYYVRRWMSENIPSASVKNYAMCSVKHVIDNKVCFERQFI